MHIATFIFITLKYEHTCTIIRASMNEPHIDNINLYVCLDIMSVDFTDYSDSFTVTDLPDISSVGYCCGTK